MPESLRIHASIIIPCYKHAHYLPDALNSVLAQTFTDWEALIIDDGSPDNTREVAAQFTNPRIRYIYQQNRGLSGARNTGIALAQGEYIALLDADDMWEPTFLQTMVTALCNDPTATAAYCGFRWVDSSGALLNQTVLRTVPPDEFRQELLLHGSWISVCSVVVRTSAYREIGPFDETLRACEDLDMWLRLSAEQRFIGIPEVLVRYRRAGNNMSDDVERMSQAFSQVIEKHLGPLSEPFSDYSLEKQASVKRLYRRRVLGYLAQGQVVESAENIAWLLSHFPDSVFSLDLWYSLACAHQLVGQRGNLQSWDQARAEQDLVALLVELDKLDVDKCLLQSLSAQAYHALAWLHYQLHDMSQVRYYLYQSCLQKCFLIDNRKRFMLFIRSLPGMSMVRDRFRHFFGFVTSMSNLP